MGFFSTIFGIGKKLIVPAINLGKKAVTALSGVGTKVRNFFIPATKQATTLRQPLLQTTIPGAKSQLESIRGITEVMPVKQGWQAIRESGKAIGGVTGRNLGGLTKAQRIAKEAERIKNVGLKANQADFISDVLAL